jgi:acyl-CoA thioester hydrolase
MEQFPIVVKIPVLWGDLDSFGHVNNARYFTWIEAGRIAYFDAVGLQTNAQGMTVGPILATTTCDFRKPVGYPDVVTVRTRVTRVGNTSFSMAYEVENNVGEAVVTATAVIVTVDYRTGQSVRVPDAVRQAIDALEG